MWRKTCTCVYPVVGGVCVLGCVLGRRCFGCFAGVSTLGGDAGDSQELSSNAWGRPQPRRL